MTNVIKTVNSNIILADIEKLSINTFLCTKFLLSYCDQQFKIINLLY